MDKKEFAKQLAEYVDLHINGPILVTSESGHKEVYQNIGTLLDYIKFEKEELLKDKVKLKSIRTDFFESEGFQTHDIEIEIEGKVKHISLQTRVFTDNQVSILCEKLGYILNNAA